MTPKNKRVIIVEDQRLVAADLEDTLKRLGYQVVGNVASGEEAIARVSIEPADLALLDVRLQGELDGIQTAEAIRKLTDIPIIYLTAYADEETVQRAMHTSPFGYLVKPFNERELRAAIEIAIYKHSTDRLLAEERSRREIAEEFKLLVDGVEDHAIFLVDPTGRVTTWNTGAERIGGHSAREVIGRHISIFYPEQDREAGKADFDLRQARTDGGLQTEGWRVRKNGTQFWASVSITPLRDENAQVRGYSMVTRDRTAYRAAELDLKESMARTRSILDSALDCIVSIDSEGRVFEWNPAAERTFGFQREEVLGREMAELIVPERFRASHREGLKRELFEGGGFILGRRVEMPARTKEGSEIIVELTVARIPAGNSPTYTGFLRDITARKEEEREKEKREVSSRLLDELTVKVASSLDMDDIVQKAARIGVPQLADWCLVELPNEKGELVRVAVAHAEPTQEAAAMRVSEEFPAEMHLPHGAPLVFSTGKPERFPSSELARLGPEYPAFLRALGVTSYLIVPIRVRNKVEGVLSFLSGEREKRYSATDGSIAEEFARRVGLALDNARHFRDAQLAIRARDEFLQIASHELKTPLTPLKLQLDSLARLLENSGVRNERLAHKLEIAARQTTRLGNLVETLLDMSQITAGRIHLETELIDLSELLHDIAERFQGEISRTGSTLTTHLDEPIVGSWDRLRLDQVLSNLISNAIKYGRGQPIRVEARMSEDTVRIEVIDHGIGIDKSALGRIFGRFERGVSARHYSGLGLGLFIARHLTEAHGGAIVAQSQLGVGSTFTVVLPRAAPRSNGTRTSEKRGEP